MKFEILFCITSSPKFLYLLPEFCILCRYYVPIFFFWIVSLYFWNQPTNVSWFAGHRIGKGEGFADLEFAMLVKMNAVNENTVIVTTVHDDQVDILKMIHFLRILFSYLFYCLFLICDMKTCSQCASGVRRTARLSIQRTRRFRRLDYHTHSSNWGERKITKADWTNLEYFIEPTNFRNTDFTETPRWGNMVTFSCVKTTGWKFLQYQITFRVPSLSFHWLAALQNLHVLLWRICSSWLGMLCYPALCWLGIFVEQLSDSPQCWTILN